MKLTFLFFTIGLMQLSASVYSQTTKLSLEMRNAKVAEVLDAIESQSEFRFAYSPGYIDLNREVAVDIREKTIDESLKMVFADTDVAFSIFDRHILLYPENLNQVTEPVVSHATGLQQRTVSGKVIDESGLPVPGVAVLVKGTTQGTVTDAIGNYSLTNIPDDATLVFSFVGMRMQEAEVENQTSINVTLIQETIGLEEVVAVGYGTQKKVNLTGAVSSVNFNNEAIKSRSLINLSSALTGLSSGTSIIQNNGAPAGGEATIRIRGVGSLNISQAPLVIIDGQIGDMANVHPNDVESISVLKDAASAAIYGSRASNGVILITTKTGKDTGNKVEFNYDGYIGVGDPTKVHDVVSNTADHMGLINLLDRNSGFNPTFTEEEINEWIENSKTDPIGYPNTNWWDVLISREIIENHNFSARGGTENLSFYSSINIQNNGGFVPNTTYKKVTFRNNMSYKVNDWMSIGNNISILDGKGEPGGLIGDYWLTAAPPNVVPKHPDGRYGGSQLPKMAFNANNPLAATETRTGERETRNVTEKLYAILTPLKGFKVTGSYFLEREDFNSWLSSNPVNYWNFQNETVAFDNTTGVLLSISQQYQKYTRNIYDLFADYNHAIGNHNLHLLAGYNQEYYKFSSFSGSKSDLLSVDIPVLNAASSNPDVNGNSTDNALRSYFGRINYNYKDKYLFESNLRYDGSSKFAPDKRWGLFPSFSVGWRISEESFWFNNKDLFSDFKLRGSWGQLGNSGIGDYEWQNFYSPARYSFNGEPVKTINYTSLASDQITWETTSILNIGADLLLFNNLFATFNYYDKYTDGILVREPIPFVNGGINAPRVNSAEVKNTGYEAELQYNVNIRKLSISMGAMMSYNKNRIEKYKGDYYEPHGRGVWTEGQPIGIYWLREVDCIVTDQNVVDNLLADGWSFKPSTPGLGDFMYKNNTDDKIIDDNDRVLMGNPIPLYNYNANLSLKYSGFDFYMLLNGVAKWDKYYHNTMNALNHNSGVYTWDLSYLNATWTEDNPDAKIPKVYRNNSINDQDSDFFLRDADFLRIKTIQFGYSLPADLIHRVKMNKVRFYINLENYFTFTNWPGQDPENSDLVYPTMKTASFGLNLSF